MDIENYIYLGLCVLAGVVVMTLYYVLTFWED